MNEENMILKPKKKNTILIVVIVIILLLVLVGLYLFVFSDVGSKIFNKGSEVTEDNNQQNSDSTIEGDAYSIDYLLKYKYIEEIGNTNSICNDMDNGVCIKIQNGKAIVEYGVYNEQTSSYDTKTKEISEVAEKVSKIYLINLLSQFDVKLLILDEKGNLYAYYNYPDKLSINPVFEKIVSNEKILGVYKELDTGDLYAETESGKLLKIEEHSNDELTITGYSLKNSYEQNHKYVDCIILDVDNFGCDSIADKLIIDKDKYLYYYNYDNSTDNFNINYILDEEGFPIQVKQGFSVNDDNSSNNDIVINNSYVITAKNKIYEITLNNNVINGILYNTKLVKNVKYIKDVNSKLVTITYDDGTTEKFNVYGSFYSSYYFSN